MNFIRKRFVILGISFILLMAIVFCLVTARNIDETKTIGDSASWNYTVKTHLINKTVRAETFDSKYSHSSTAALGEKVSSSGMISAGKAAIAEVEGSILDTAIVYWNVFDNEESEK
jgi:hypothetical protein